MELEAMMTQLRDYICERFSVPNDDPGFNDDVHLFDYGYVDSFGAADLISFVEKAFSVQVKPSDLVAYPLNTVREISTFALKRRQGAL
jgi:methoxymalonate biosynthesis acyl carrier protein